MTQWDLIVWAGAAAIAILIVTPPLMLLTFCITFARGKL